jgi:hypothetical protein
MNRKFTVSPDDPWYVDPTNTLAVMDYVRRHVDGSQHCTHGHGSPTVISIWRLKHWWRKTKRYPKPCNLWTI